MLEAFYRFPGPNPLAVLPWWITSQGSVAILVDHGDTPESRARKAQAFGHIAWGVDLFRVHRSHYRESEEVAQYLKRYAA